LLIFEYYIPAREQGQREKRRVLPIFQNFYEVLTNRHAVNKKRKFFQKRY
jgi:hypothetical protein